MAEFWEVEGHTGPGDFAPVVIAEKLTRIGDGQLPEPAHPSWNQLINGSMDVQWVEFQGLVTGHSKQLVDHSFTRGQLQCANGGLRRTGLGPVQESGHSHSRHPSCRLESRHA